MVTVPSGNAGSPNTANPGSDLSCPLENPKWSSWPLFLAISYLLQISQMPVKSAVRVSRKHGFNAIEVAHDYIHGISFYAS